MIVTIQDIRDAGLCSRGARGWAKQNNYDFRDFLQNGMPIERMEAFGDAFCMQVVNHVRQREALKKDSNGQE